MCNLIKTYRKKQLQFISNGYRNTGDFKGFTKFFMQLINLFPLKSGISSFPRTRKGGGGPV